MTEQVLVSNLVYGLIVILFMVGIYGMLEKKNFLKKILGMNMMQVAVIIFFLTIGQKIGASVPILIPGVNNIDVYANPLPHTLMLTAIVVSLSILGVGLSLLTRLQRHYGSIEEDEILRRMNDE